jgi:hypothetical protein
LCSSVLWLPGALRRALANGPRGRSPHSASTRLSTPTTSRTPSPRAAKLPGPSSAELPPRSHIRHLEGPRTRGFTRPNGMPPGMRPSRDHSRIEARPVCPTLGAEVPHDTGETSDAHHHTAPPQERRHSHRCCRCNCLQPAAGHHGNGWRQPSRAWRRQHCHHNGRSDNRGHRTRGSEGRWGACRRGRTPDHSCRLLPRRRHHGLSHRHTPRRGRRRLPWRRARLLRLR